MPIKKIVVPADITIKDFLTDVSQGVVETWDHFLKIMLLSPGLQSEYLGVVTAVAVNKANSERTGSELLVAEDDWQRLKAVIEKPSYYDKSGGITAGFPFPPVVSMQLYPFMQAIVNAK